MVEIGFCYSDDFYLNYSLKSNFKGFFGPNPKTFASKRSSLNFLYDHSMT
jgi:hypothetical protein